MRDKVPLNDWNWLLIMLNQALLGSVSCNFRMVCLVDDDSRWQVEFVLEADDALDREEISEVMEDFSMFVDDVWNEISPASRRQIHHVIRISTEPLATHEDHFRRVAFRRREN